MTKHRLTVESVTMELQCNQEGKTKVTRSAARHLRRKKLSAARRETERHLLSDDNSDEKHGTVLIKNISNIFENNFKSDSDNVKKENIHINATKTNDSDLINNINSVLVHKSNKNNDLHCCHSKVKEKTLSQRLKIENRFRIENQQSGSCDKSSFIILTKNYSQSQMDSQEKTREQIKAEREAKKAAKAAAKAKGKVVKDKEENTSTVQPDKIKTESKCQEKSRSNETANNKATSELPQSIKENITQNVTAEGKRKSDVKCKDDEGDKSENKLKAGEKSKAELKAERRAKQEAQRAAKHAALKPVEEKKKPVKSQPEKVQTKSSSPSSKDESTKKILIKLVNSEVKDNAHEVNLFKHLYINKKNISQLINCSNIKIHPAILRLGVQYAEKVIVGSNARCVALLAAIKQLIEDFERPSQADFTRGLEASLQESVNYLNFCRPSAVSMQNALKHLKWQMSMLPSTVPDKEAKFKLASAIDTYINEQILLAGKAISDAIQKKILNGDVILTYGFSSLICKILCDAYSAGKQFRVVIVDGRPWLEGKELLRRLVKHGIDCSYILINALSFIMPQVSKVFLGAHAILANGAVMSRVGTAQVALIANAFNVPVLVACETHKSCERVQTDSIVYNEIGDPDQLVKSTFSGSKKSCLSNWKTRKTLNLLNITYDVTPADLVTAVVTELAILPCTSVPVILRMKI